MGLTIHYKLKAKGAHASARKLVESLHQAAHDLPFKALGDIVDLSGDECVYEKRDKDDPLRWLLIQAGGNLRLKNTHDMGNGKRGDSWMSINPSRIIAFTAWPGEGCEESNFGLCQYPAEIFDPELGTIKTKMSGWHWSSFCKTQYASDPHCGGVKNFLQCHLTVIAMLDKAKALGCLDEASDEGKFWERRNIEELVKEIGSWNQMIAAFGGKLKDVLGGGVEMPIADYPDFEQLEMAGQKQLPPEIEQLAQLIKQVSQKS
jgi:hypothetical protein